MLPRFGGSRAYLPSNHPIWVRVRVGLRSGRPRREDRRIGCILAGIRAYDEVLVITASLVLTWRSWNSVSRPRLDGSRKS